MIWKDLKAFHRRRVLQCHFHNDNNILDNENRKLVSILAKNLDCENNPHHNIHSKFKHKSKQNTCITEKL